MALKIFLVIVIATGVGLTFVVSSNHFDAPAKTIRAPDKPANHDTRLQTVATSALGTREGAIVIINPQTGRVHAVVNPALAFSNAVPPGSTIKPFTALAALRGGIVTQNTRMRCRGKHNREDVIDACSHPANLEPFSPTEALAYSCNYYFATIGARLDEDNFARMLADFGFGQATGIDTDEESPGVLAHGTWQTESAIGEGAFLQVTPIQMAMAYAALFNGGRLLKPTNDSTTRVRAQLHIDENERSVLLEGMRGAVTFGTAEKAELTSLRAYVVGKTGTSTQLQGFRSQGWFVGLAFPDQRQTGPEDEQLLVVVYLKRAHGAEAAQVARPIFEEFAGGQRLTQRSADRCRSKNPRAVGSEL